MNEGIEQRCSICGTPVTDVNRWSSNCRLHGGITCYNCCRKCEFFRGLPGNNYCGYKTEKELRAELMEKKRRETELEERRISAQYNKRRKQRRAEHAIRLNSMRKNDRDREAVHER